MNDFNELKKEFKSLNGNILLIGDLTDKLFSIIENNSKLTGTFYLNSYSKKSDIELESASVNVASNMSLKNLHKYFKNGINNICCNYNEKFCPLSLSKGVFSYLGFDKLSRRKYI